MKLAAIVTQFPPSGDATLARELMAFMEAGVDLRIYHLTPWRQDLDLPGFAAPLAARARHIAPFGPEARRAVWRHRGLARQCAGRILRHAGRAAGASLALIGAGLRLGEELAAWGADHMHAAGDGPPATAAWIAHHISGRPFSLASPAPDLAATPLLPVLVHRASAVRAVSDHGRTHLAERIPGLARDRIELVRPGFGPVPAAAPPMAQGGRFRVLFSGTLQPRAGLDVLLNALAGLDFDWTARIVGTGPDREALAAQAGELGIARRVRFLGAAPPDRVAALIQGAHVCVAPSVVDPRGGCEGVPGTLVEALARRRPAVGTNVGGIPELLRPGRTGWLAEPGCVVGLRRALEEIQHDPETAARVAARGQALVAAEYDPDRSARALLEMFTRGSAGTAREAAARSRAA